MIPKLNRFQLLRFILPTAFLAGILISFELWFPAARSFPRAPFLIALPTSVLLLIERLLSTILITTLILIAVKRDPRIFSIVAIASCCLLIFFDQMRLQPWVYQYLLLLIVLTLNNWPITDEPSSNHTLAMLQLIVAVLYFWSGVQKLNFSFIHETLPKLLVPLQKVFPSPPLVALGVSIALSEMFIGCGLLFRRTRKLSIGLAVTMHGVVLGLLIASRYNSVVWVWNVTLMVMVVLLFWQSEEATWQLLFNWRSRPLVTCLAQVLVVTAALLPILSFWGRGDMYLSGALYSGNTVVAVIHINEEIFKKLPPIVQQQVFQTKRGEQILPLLEWSIVELNVPPYPEPRVYKQLTRQVCNLVPNNNAIELVMKERPAILDGSYHVTCISCAQLGQ